MREKKQYKAIKYNKDIKRCSKMKTKTTTVDDYDFEVVCKTCGRSRKGGQLVTHQNGTQTVIMNVPSFCIWCEQIAEEKENKEVE